MLVIRRVFFGMVWAIVLYLGLACAIGLSVGVYVATQPQHRGKGPDYFRAMGEDLGARLWPYLAVGAVGLAGYGSLTGKLPGTRDRSPAYRTAQPAGDRGAGLAAGMLVVASLAVAGAAWFVLRTPTFAPGQLEQVRAGMTLAQVEKLLGAPPGDYSVGGLPTATFTDAYTHRSWIGPDRALTVFLDGTNRVIDTRVYPVQRPAPARRPAPPQPAPRPR